MAVRFGTSGNSRLTRTANLPTSTAFTICGWSKIAADTGTYAALAAVEVYASKYVQLIVDPGSTVVTVYSDSGSGYGVASVAVGDVFFWALTANGSGAGAVTGHIKHLNTPGGLSSLSIAGSAFTPSSVSVGSDAWGESFNGSTWNVKCWDRALTPEELLVESAYERVMYPASLNFHWPLDSVSDANDRSGNGRNPTFNGTVTTEDNESQPWKPSNKVFLPVASGGGGGNSQTLAATLDGLSASASQTLSHSQSATATLDAIAVAASQSLVHGQSMAATLGDAVFASSQTRGSSQALAATLADVTVAAAQTRGRSQTLAATLADVVVSGTQDLTHNQSVTAPLDDVTVSAVQTLVHSQSLTATLADVATSVTQSRTGSLSQSLAAQLDSVSVDFIQSLHHSQALTAALADVSVLASQGLVHGQSLSLPLEGIALAVSQTSVHPQTVSVSLESVSAAVSQTLVHSQSLSATLSGISVEVQQGTLGAVGQSIAFTLDSLAGSIQQTLSHEQSISLVLDDVLGSVQQVPSHGQLVALSLDGVSCDVQQALSHAQSLSATLQDIELSLEQEFSLVQILDVSLSGIDVQVLQELQPPVDNSQLLAAVLDSISLEAFQTRIGSQSCSVQLDSLSALLLQINGNIPAAMLQTRDTIDELLATVQQESHSATTSSASQQAQLVPFYDSAALVSTNYAATIITKPRRLPR